VPLRHTLFDGVGGVGEPVWHAGRPRSGQNIMLKPTLGQPEVKVESRAFLRFVRQVAR